jgi:phospholipid transport system substrate-binding protein
MTRFVAAALVALLASGTAQAQQLQPIDALRGPVEAALAILQDPRYRVASERTAQKEKLWEIIRKVFDFQGITERAVGRNWGRFTPAQQRDFSDVFSKLLGDSYLNKIQGGYNNEKVEFLGQELLSETKARVRTRIVREVDVIPVDYSVRADGGAWRIYDVNIEGVSLVQNYRSQFDQILSSGTPDALFERVRAKNTAQEKAAAGGRP